MFSAVLVLRRGSKAVFCHHMGYNVQLMQAAMKQEKKSEQVQTLSIKVLQKPESTAWEDQLNNCVFKSSALKSVATADNLPPSHPIPAILLCNKPSACPPSLLITEPHL